MLQKLPLNDFRWVEDISKFDVSFIGSYNRESNERCFFEVDVQFPENLYNLHSDLPFLPKIIKI